MPSAINQQIEEIKLMLKYMGINSFCIPAFDVPMPCSMNGYYRPQRVWHIHSNGRLSYKGFGYERGKYNITVPDITREHIVPISPSFDQYIVSAHKFLVEDCKKRLNSQVRMSDIPLLRTVLKQFYNLDFL